MGAESVAWDLTGHGQIHGRYQQLLNSLASEGVLIGVASKNDPKTVQQAFARKDMLLEEAGVFPFEVHWNEKSGSVGRILRQWNIGAGAVVFVDDSPMELAEVQAAHPDIDCVLFPKDDYSRTVRFFEEMRNRFGRHALRDEDTLRLSSLRQAAEWNDSAATSPATLETLLAGAEATLTFDFQAAKEDGRVLELVNKTNQFNLNGVRITEADWRRQLACPGAFVCSVSYQDRFGPLGKIAVVKGCHDESEVHVDTWVMSCRAFSRRIEYRTLEVLLRHFKAREISFEFVSTAKNGPLKRFFESLLWFAPSSGFRLDHATFLERCPVLHHKVEYTNA